jgi:uncharacterized membrane protein
MSVVWVPDQGESVTFLSSMERVVQIFELVGVAVLALGGVIGFLRYGLRYVRREQGDSFGILRHDIGRAILLGLEILIIADIVKTITIETTFESAASLGLIVLVRTFLSFSLEIELYGAPPWRRAETSPESARELRT